MIKVIVELWPRGDESKKKTLGTLSIANDGTGDSNIGNYQGVLVSEYTNGRKGRVFNFKRQEQSVWSLIGAFLKLFGHTKHSPKDMIK